VSAEEWRAPRQPRFEPGAKPDDGLLDLYSASPHRLQHWISLCGCSPAGPKRGDQVDQHTGKRVKIRIDGVDNYQLDGDVIGACTTLAEIEPGALTICVPPAGDQSGI
jgi:diacylglycerol kinase family enzyme